MWSSSSWSLLLSPSFFPVVSSFFGLGKCVRGAQLEQSIKNGRDIRPGNCRPFLSGSRGRIDRGRKNREEQSTAAKGGVLSPAHSLGGVVRRHFFVAPRSPWAHFTAT